MSDTSANDPEDDPIPDELEDGLHDLFDDIENRAGRGIDTGFPTLDQVLHGLRAGQVIVVGSRPGVGKTSFLLNILEHAAVDAATPCAFFTLETNKRDLSHLLLCSRARIDSTKLRAGLLRSDQYAQMADVVSALAKAPIWIDDSPDLTVEQFRRRLRRLVEQHGIKLALIDYLQLMNRPRRDNLHEELAEMMRNLKQEARALSVPIVLASQLNPPAEDSHSRKPRLTDLRDSRSIGDEADVVLLIHREDHHRMTEPDYVPDNTAEVIIAKQRGGPTGTTKLTFIPAHSRFENPRQPHK